MRSAFDDIRRNHFRKKNSAFVILLIVILIALICLISCSGAIGFTVGIVADQTVTPRVRTNSWRVDSFNIGRKLIVFLDDGSKFSGRYAGLYKIGDEIYNSEYSVFIDNSLTDVYLPSPGDTVTIETAMGAYPGLLFKSFGYSYGDKSKKIDEKHRARCYYILVEYSGEKKRYSLDEVHIIRGQGDNMIYSYTLLLLLENSNMPLITGVKFSTSDGLKYVRYSRISSIKYDKKVLKWIGLAVGLFYDLVSYEGFSNISIGNWD